MKITITLNENNLYNVVLKMSKTSKRLYNINLSNISKHVTNTMLNTVLSQNIQNMISDNMQEISIQKNCKFI